MKKLIILLVVMALCTIVYSQRFAVSVLKPQAIVYIGLDNALSCVVEEQPCDSIFLSTDNGVIKKTGCNDYLYNPAKVADSKILIFVKEKGGSREIGEYAVRVRKIPDPIATIGKSAGGPVSKEMIKAQAGVRTDWQESIGIEVKSAAIEFELSILRQGKTIFSEKNNGNAFMPTIKEALQTLQRGDIIVVASIKAVKPDGEVVSLKSLEFTIED